LLPLGDVAALPDTFRWRATVAHEVYFVEIYTPDLETVFRSQGLADLALVVDDSLRLRLEAERTYLWHVQARDGLVVTASSPEAWFRIKP
jgi:hypothetical protein